MRHSGAAEVDEEIGEKRRGENKRAAVKSLPAGKEQRGISAHPLSFVEVANDLTVRVSLSIRVMSCGEERLVTLNTPCRGSSDLPNIHRPVNPRLRSADYLLYALRGTERKLQKPLFEGKLDMSKEAAHHHKQAAEHLEHAARHHHEAAKHHEAGNHEKAAHHAHLAHGHLVHATEHAENAAKEHVKAHGAK